MTIAEKIDSLLIPATVKSYLNNKTVLQKKHYFYTHLTDFYSPAFSFESSGKLEQICLASYLYFRALLLADSLLDDPKNKNQNLLTLLPVFEEAVKGLAWLFQANDPFWNRFYELKKNYFATILFEKKASEANNQIDYDQFLKIAIGKSNICYAIFDALASVSESPEDHEQLLISLQQIHVAFQCMDDIDDFKRDLVAGQRTYAICKVESKLVHAGILLSVNDDFKYRYFFTSGIAGELMQDARNRFESAASIASRYNLGALVDFLKLEIAKCKDRQYEINLLIEKAKIQSSKATAIIGLQIQSTNDRVDLGVEYLKTNLGADGLWEDFLTTAGFGKFWISAFAGTQISGISAASKLVDKLSNSLTDAMGSFNDSIVDDGDSLNFVTAFQLINCKKIQGESIHKWLRFMDASGGWCTYRDEEGLRQRLKLPNATSLTGWNSSVDCVSAAACYALSLSSDLFEPYIKTAQHLSGSVNSHGFWNSYWWTSPIYATSFAVQALIPLPGYHAYCENACVWLLSQQAKNGAWTHLKEARQSACYTALAAQALLQVDATKHRASIEAAILWLKQNQTLDGSWMSERILRIPAPGIEDPDQFTNWRKSSFGVNILVDDHNRIFTTSAVLKSLHLYHQLLES